MASGINRLPCQPFERCSVGTAATVFLKFRQGGFASRPQKRVRFWGPLYTPQSMSPNPTEMIVSVRIHWSPIPDGSAGGFWSRRWQQVVAGIRLWMTKRTFIRLRSCIFSSSAACVQYGTTIRVFCLCLRHDRRCRRSLSHRVFSSPAALQPQPRPQLAIHRFHHQFQQQQRRSRSGRRSTSSHSPTSAPRPLQKLVRIFCGEEFPNRQTWKSIHKVRALQRQGSPHGSGSR